MAGRLVLLSFPNYKEGEEFARQVASGGVLGGTPVMPVNATVEWVAARPTVACKCAQTKAVSKRRIRNSRRDRNSTDNGYTMRVDWGWWIHAKCMKPARLVVEHFATNMIGGSYDLLPKILDDPDRKPNDLRKFRLGG
jgi:hypothetical protein